MKSKGTKPENLNEQMYTEEEVVRMHGMADIIQINQIVTSSISIHPASPSGNISSWATPAGFIWLKYSVEYTGNLRNLEELGHFAKRTLPTTQQRLNDPLYESPISSKSYR